MLNDVMARCFSLVALCCLLGVVKLSGENIAGICGAVFVVARKRLTKPETRSLMALHFDFKKRYSLRVNGWKHNFSR